MLWFDSKEVRFLCSSKNTNILIHHWTGFQFKSPLLCWCPYLQRQKKNIIFEWFRNEYQKNDGWKARFLSFGGKLTLLKSVLSPIPIHTLAVWSPPKTGISKMKSVMANWLWDSNGEHRHHWIAWDSICQSMKEGGLVIRQEICMPNLRGLMLLVSLSGASLWDLNRVIHWMWCLSLFLSDLSSHVWRNVFPHVSTILGNSHWVVGAGNISLSMANRGAGAFSVQNVDLNTPFREVIQSADFSTLVLPSLSTEAQSIL